MLKRHNQTASKSNRLSLTPKDQFIIAHNRANKYTEDLSDIKSLDLRRVIFISLHGLHNTWRNTPSHVLYSAILMLPLKRDWIYNPEADLATKHSIFSSDTEASEEFIEMIKWKDSQKLVFWMLDGYETADYSNTESLIAPFWANFNNKLTQLYDPITRHKYNALKFCSKWWTNNKKFAAEQNVTSVSVLSELYFTTMKYATIKAILTQSNSESFRVLTAYTNDGHCQVFINNLYNDQSEDMESEHGWFISDAYDPYDI